MTSIVITLALGLAALSCAVYFANTRLFKPTRPVDGEVLPPVSVLIPARDEAAGIADAVGTVLRSTGVTLEVVVLDDHSSDDTAAIVEGLSAVDERVRLVRGQTLPDGWCGKQFACWQLAQAAHYDTLLWIDADVRLNTDAVSRTVSELTRREVGLLSGVPRQITPGLADGLLIPLIHFLLLGYLPLWISRTRPDASLAAGCGQFFATTKAAYRRAGGHAVIRESMHDGLKLPQSYRAAGESTDLVDVTDVASCRMYEASRDVWPGLTKNAVEGVAAPNRIGPFSVLLFGGHVLPFVLFAAAFAGELVLSPAWLGCTVAACAASWAVRLDAARRFSQPWWSAVLHPLGVLTFLTLQWWAFGKHVFGIKPTWRGRGVVEPASVTDVPMTLTTEVTSSDEPAMVS